MYVSCIQYLRTDPEVYYYTREPLRANRSAWIILNMYSCVLVQWATWLMEKKKETETETEVESVVDNYLLIVCCFMLRSKIFTHMETMSVPVIEWRSVKFKLILGASGIWAGTYNRDTYCSNTLVCQGLTLSFLQITSYILWD
jgi:hypothetical protein